MSQIHVTRVSGKDVFGHETSHCDAGGCAGDEQYFSGVDGTDVSRGDVIEDETYEECAYCGRTHDKVGVVPDVSDDVAWSKLSAYHVADCEWIATRAHRVFAK